MVGIGEVDGEVRLGQGKVWDLGSLGGILGRKWGNCKRFRIWVWLRGFDMGMSLVGGGFLVGKG